MITINDFKNGNSFKLKHDTGEFSLNNNQDYIVYKNKEKEKEYYYSVVEISETGFHIANPYVEGAFIYYEFNQFYHAQQLE